MLKYWWRGGEICGSGLDLILRCHRRGAAYDRGVNDLMKVFRTLNFIVDSFGEIS